MLGLQECSTTSSLWGAQDAAQSFVRARQVLYPLSYMFSPSLTFYKRFIYFHAYECLQVVCAPQACSTNESQKRAVDLLELESQRVGSHCVRAGS